MRAWRPLLSLAVLAGAWSCRSTGPVGPSPESPMDAAAPPESGAGMSSDAAPFVGKPCTTLADCATNTAGFFLGCAYLLSDGCGAKGFCLQVGGCTGGNPPPPVCACSGGLAGSFCGPQGGYVAGYATQPVLGYADDADPNCGVVDVPPYGADDSGPGDAATGD
jgi:hypothetical protein